MLSRISSIITKYLSINYITGITAFLVWIILSSLITKVLYFPNFFTIYQLFIEQSEIIFKHFGVSLLSAFFGFLLGLVLAIICSVFAVNFRKTRSGIFIISLILYSIPLIAAAPITALVFGPQYSGVALGAIGSFLPIFLTGIRTNEKYSKNYENLLNSYGISKSVKFRLLNFPLLVRGWIIGADSGWIWAVLGALLGDFTGGRWGLGTFLIGTLVRGEPNRVYLIIITSVFLSLVGLIIIKWLKQGIISKSEFDPLETTSPFQHDSFSKSKGLSYVYLFLGFIITWQIGALILNYEGGIVSSPYDLFLMVKILINGDSQFTIILLLNSLLTTWTISIIGIILAIIFAFLLASSEILFTVLSKPILGIIFITQVTPIVAFIPLIALILGRNEYSIILIVVLSTIYPSYIIFNRSLHQVSLQALDITNSLGANKYFNFFKIRIPYSYRYSLVAFRLAIGRGLLGAITGEYLLTGTGIGGILGQTRALLDFRYVWLICVFVAILTLITDLSSIKLTKLYERFKVNLTKSNL